MPICRPFVAHHDEPEVNDDPSISFPNPRPSSLSSSKNLIASAAFDLPQSKNILKSDVLISSLLTRLINKNVVFGYLNGTSSPASSVTLTDSHRTYPSSEA